MKEFAEGFLCVTMPAGIGFLILKIVPNSPLIAVASVALIAYWLGLWGGVRSRVKA